MGIIPKPTSTMFGGEFLEYAPDKSYAKNEARGNVSWDGGGLPFIPCHCVVAQERPLDPAMAHFLKHLFKPGVVNKNLPQSNFLAQTRVPGQAAPQVKGTAGPVPFYDPKAAAMRPIKPGLNETQLKQVVTANPHLEGIFLRSSFTVRDEKAAEQVYKLMSGKVQKGHRAKSSQPRPPTKVI
jgi:hypothetical protein